MLTHYSGTIRVVRSKEVQEVKDWARYLRLGVTEVALWMMVKSHAEAARVGTTARNLVWKTSG